MLISVTDHAASRFRQRVRGTLEPKLEIVARVRASVERADPAPGPQGELLVRDRERRDLVFVCRREGDELVVITLWEEGDAARVPKRFTDALRRDDHRVGETALRREPS